VLYLFDGQNVFSDEGSFAGGWYVHEAADRLVPAARLVAPIVVGIDHGGEKRLDELGPWKQGDKGGRTDELLAWMGGTLMPVVQERFPVMTGPVGTVVGGSSMGGLAAMYAHCARPDLFGGAIVMSPSFWFAKRRIRKFVADSRRPPISRIYLDCGLREGKQMVEAAREMAVYLKARGYSEDQLMWRPDARGTHSERHWRRRIRKALRFMFRR
jgi:predicted alpha/beta superfamily hydrolase